LAPAGCGSARGEDAELVALGVGKDDPAHVALADVDRLGADSAEACDLGAVVVVEKGATSRCTRSLAVLDSLTRCKSR
jgi:hypothetical protein